MKKYSVELPITGSLFIGDIEADSEEEAIEKAFNIKYDKNAHNVYWSTIDRVVQGNVFYGEINEPEVTLEEDE